MSTSEKEYSVHFEKFYRELFKFQTGTKKQLTCPGCTTKKRFIFGKDQLKYSCGPQNSANNKCGPQYTIDLPKYISFRELKQVYDEQINGSFTYDQGSLLEYDLHSLSKKMNVKQDLERQTKIVKDAQESLKRLISDYTETNSLNEHVEMIKSLEQKRYKNSIEKKKIMRDLGDEDLSDEVQRNLRKKYATLINENIEFMDMISELRKPLTDFIMYKKPLVTKHSHQGSDNDDEPEPEPEPSSEYESDEDEDESDEDESDEDEDEEHVGW